MAITGTMQVKMPANRIATSWIGPQPNPLAARCRRLVSFSEAKATATNAP